MFGRTPLWARCLNMKIDNLTQQIGKIMALVQIDQADLDNLATKLEALVTEVKNIPPATLPPANETAVNQAVTDLQTAVTALTPPTTA